MGVATMRGGCCGGMLWLVSDRVVHIVVDVECGEGELRGRVSDGGGAPRPFCGWLGLIAALDALIGSSGGEGVVVDRAALDR